MIDLFKKVSSNIIFRALLETGGWIGGLAFGALQVWNALPPGAQATLGRIIQGEGADITLGAAFTVVTVVGSKVWAMIVNTKPQVVANNKAAPLPKVADAVPGAETTNASVTKAVEKVVDREPSFFERILSALPRKKRT